MVAPPAAAAPAASITVAPASHPPRGIPRFHPVRPGESLWSIAESLLGGRASSPAVAAEVARLWQLNERRIGTGNPNLLPVGVKLRLR
jgi:Tfp pilus assembly protein FimV